MSNGDRLRARYLVGCDGGRSLIHKGAGIAFTGWDPTTSWLIAEVDWSEEPEWGFRHDAIGTHAIGKLEDGRAGVVLTEPQLGCASEPTLRDVREALIAVYGTDFGIHNPTWISRFTDMTRQAAAYRERPVLLAADAERHPVAARVLRNTMALVALRRPDERTKALADYASELLAMDEPRRRLVGEMSGLDIHHDLGEGHPLSDAGCPISSSSPQTGRFGSSFLHDARPVLLNLREPGDVDITSP